MEYQKQTLTWQTSKLLCFALFPENKGNHKAIILLTNWSKYQHRSLRLRDYKDWTVGYFPVVNHLTFNTNAKTETQQTYKSLSTNSTVRQAKPHRQLCQWVSRHKLCFVATLYMTPPFSQLKINKVTKLTQQRKC